MLCVAGWWMKLKMKEKVPEVYWFAHKINNKAILPIFCILLTIFNLFYIWSLYIFIYFVFMYYFEHFRYIFAYWTPTLSQGRGECESVNLSIYRFILSIVSIMGCLSIFSLFLCLLWLFCQFMKFFIYLFADEPFCHCSSVMVFFLYWNKLF